MKKKKTCHCSIELREIITPFFNYLPIIDAATGAWPVVSSAGTAHNPQRVNNEAVILYFRIVSANGPFKITLLLILIHVNPTICTCQSLLPK
jgi:hypothetical protein